MRSNEDRPRRVYLAGGNTRNYDLSTNLCKRCGERGHYTQDCRSEKIITREQREQLFKEGYKKKGDIINYLQEEEDAHYQEIDSDQENEWWENVCQEAGYS